MKRFVKCLRRGNPARLINRIDAGSWSVADSTPCEEDASSRRKARSCPLHLQYSQATKNPGLEASSQSATGEPFKVPQIFTQAKTPLKSSCTFARADFTSAPPLQSETRMILSPRCSASQAWMIVEFSVRVPVLDSGINSHRNPRRTASSAAQPAVRAGIADSPCRKPPERLPTITSRFAANSRGIVTVIRSRNPGDERSVQR